ncbi:MAG: GNAT family N-acetyltransferase [Planctomycetes bacterium]|nr:GNAT family N-acetyltransferase [Planctomycetota bacterium]
MNHGNPAKQAILRDLGDGLILRRSTPRDTKALEEHNSSTLDGGGDGIGVRFWIRDLMTRPHPTFRQNDFTIVEDTKTGKVVSSLNLIPQTWSYAGIEFKVGRPEVVSTHPDYRGRGLIRTQFEVVHEWSAQRGHKMTAITGIPYFYRQFGYEMAVTRGGGRMGDKSQIPLLKKGQKDPYRVRAAREADLPFLTRLYKEGNSRYLLSDVRNRTLWRYELKGRNRKSYQYRNICVIETAKGKRVGFLAHERRLCGDAMGAGQYELRPGVSWLAVTPSVLRYLKKTGETFAKRDKKDFNKLVFMLGSEHPVYAVIADRLKETRKPYAWYVRVPDLPDFLRHISPALEQRLADSALAGYTGEFKIGFFRSGLRMRFRNGRLTKAESLTPYRGERGNAWFPGLTFLQLLFGYRTLEELTYAFPDCGASGDVAHVLLNTLFPKQPSNIWPVG